MKKTILTLCVGMMIGLLAGSMTGAFAAIGDRLEAVVAEYTIIVDGVEQVLEVSPVAINDSTYVPLRAAAAMFGKDVTYKADSRTIELNTPITTPTEQSMEVEGVDAINTDKTIEEKITEIDRRISSANTMLSSQREALEYAESLGEEDNRDTIATLRSGVLKIESTIADLEAQLAAVKAQSGNLEAN